MRYLALKVQTTSLMSTSRTTKHTKLNENNFPHHPDNIAEDKTIHLLDEE